MADAQQRRQEGVPAGLLQQAVPGIHQYDHQLGGGRTGHHVAGVLDVSRGVGNDEFPLGSGEVAVGNVDGDALFPLGPQAVGDQSQVGVVVAPVLGRLLHRRPLVFHHSLGVVE